MNIYQLAAIIEPGNLPQTPANQTTLNKVFSLAFVFLGSIAILMMVIGGLQYVLARSNPENAAKARNRIIYALIGLVIIALAAAIVNVVVNHISI